MNIAEIFDKYWAFYPSQLAYKISHAYVTFKCQICNGYYVKVDRIAWIKQAGFCSFTSNEFLTNFNPNDHNLCLHCFRFLERFMKLHYGSLFFMFPISHININKTKKVFALVKELCDKGTQK